MNVKTVLSAVFAYATLAVAGTATASTHNENLCQGHSRSLEDVVCTCECLECKTLNIQKNLIFQEQAAPIQQKIQEDAAVPVELKPNEEAAPSLHDNSLCNESGCACLCFDCTMMRERAQEASDDKKGCKPLDPSLPEKEEPVQNETETPTKDAPNETIEKLTYPDHNGVLCRQDECRCNCYDCLVMQKHA